MLSARLNDCRTRSLPPTNGVKPSWTSPSASVSPRDTVSNVGRRRYGQRNVVRRHNELVELIIRWLFDGDLTKREVVINPPSGCETLSDCGERLASSTEDDAVLTPYIALQVQADEVNGATRDLVACGQSVAILLENADQCRVQFSYGERSVFFGLTTDGRYYGYGFGDALL